MVMIISFVPIFVADFGQGTMHECLLSLCTYFADPSLYTLYSLCNTVLPYSLINIHHAQHISIETIKQETLSLLSLQLKGVYARPATKYRDE